MDKQCPLCSSDSKHYITVDSYSYNHCNQCNHIWLDSTHYLKEVEESERYLLHNNNADNISYVNYLTRIYNECEKYAPKSSLESGVVDYGCCAEEVMVKVIEKSGYEGYGYDPLFNIVVPLNNLPVGVVIASESVEHFYNPLTEFKQIHSWLKPGGTLFIKTSLTDTVDDFGSWWYRKDPTHVQFFSRQSFQFIAETIGFRLLFAEKNTVVLEKK